MNNTYLSMDFDHLSKGLTGTTVVKVSNMSRKRVTYIIPEIHVEREFREFIEGQLPDSKSVPFGELYALNNLPGGRQLIWDNLHIDSDQARKALELPVSDDTPEVDYSREKVREILLRGTDEEVLDMIEFGPYYIAEWVKEEILTIDSFSRRAFIGKLFKISVADVSDNLKWASEDPGVQGYGSIKGVNVGTGTTRPGRRAGAQVSSGETGSSEGTQARRARRS